MARASREGERLLDWMRRVDRRLGVLERSSPAAIILTDDDENDLVTVGDFGNGSGGLRLYAADGSVLWEQSRGL